MCSWPLREAFEEETGLTCGVAMEAFLLSMPIIRTGWLAEKTCAASGDLDFEAVRIFLRQETAGLFTLAQGYRWTGQICQLRWRRIIRTAWMNYIKMMSIINERSVLLYGRYNVVPSWWEHAHASHRQPCMTLNTCKNSTTSRDGPTITTTMNTRRQLF
jgi:hypothetical protein